MASAHYPAAIGASGVLSAEKFWACSLMQAEAWGRPTFTAPPSGAVLRARFCAQDAQLQGAWQNLTHALGGLFCSSLHLMVRCMGRADILESLCACRLPACSLLSSVICPARPAAELLCGTIWCSLLSAIHCEALCLTPGSSL